MEKKKYMVPQIKLKELCGNAGVMVDIGSGSGNPEEGDAKAYTIDVPSNEDASANDGPYNVWSDD